MKICRLSRPEIQGIKMDDVYYSLMQRIDDREALDWAFELLEEIETEFYEFPEETYDSDNAAEILSILGAYARGYFEMSDVMSIMNDEYPWMTLPWDDWSIKL